ncbi:MAG: hypothetical protein WDA75_22995 [Candidatus Latescibacterota bacterium]|jgi:hypothetical protein
MVQTEPNPEQYRHLCEAAARVHQMAPWEWLDEEKIFWIRPPGADQTAWISLLGMLGQYHAVLLLRGDLALRQYRQLHEEDRNPERISQELVEIAQVHLALVPRDALKPAERRLIRQAGVTTPGEGAWPLFRAYDSGLIERPLDRAETELLLHALEQILQVAPRVRQSPGLLVDRRRGALLVRVGQEGGWLDRYEVPDQPALPWERGQADPFTLSRLRQLKRTRRTVELAFFHLWSPIVGEPDLPPYYPYLLMAVDAGTGEFLGFETLRPAPSYGEMWQQLPSHLARLFEAAGGVPVEVRVDSQRLQAALQPLLDSLQILLFQAPLRRLTEARASLEQELDGASRIDPSLPAVEPPMLPAWADPALPLDQIAACYQHIASPKVPAKGLAGIERTLRAQPFDADQPGTVRRDLETLIRAIGDQPLELTPAEGVPKGRFMAEVNGMLANPFPAANRQPAPRSFPNVRGLYHLLWSTGLGRVLPEQQYFLLDQAAVAEWCALSPTEQYFSLLEAWLLGPDPDGDPTEGSDAIVPLEPCLFLVNELVQEPICPATHSGDYEILRLETGLTNLSLAALFGLVARTAMPVRSGRLPVLAQAFGLVEPTLWGQQLIARLELYLYRERGNKDSARARREDGLMPAWKHLFPAWKRRLERPRWQEWQNAGPGNQELVDHQEAEPAPDTWIPDGRSGRSSDHADRRRPDSDTRTSQPQVVVKVALHKSWRRLAVPAGKSLHELAQAIIAAFDFDFDHLYAYYRGTRPGEGPAIGHPGLEEGQRADQTRIADLGLQPGDRLVLLFDFGDEWLFRLEVEEARLGEGNQVEILERQGRPPAQYPR